MASSNPAFRNSPAFSAAGTAQLAKLSQPTMTGQELEELYSQPSAGALETDRMTYEDTILKIVASFAVLLVGAAIGWFFPILMIPALVIGFVLALVNIFKKKPSPVLILSYAAVEGALVGALAHLFEIAYPGIAFQAVLGTFVVIAVTLGLFASGKVRASAKATKVFMIAMIGYLAFSVINLVLMWTGLNTQPWGMRSIEILPGVPLGVVLGILVILLCAYSLVMDFDSIKVGVERGAPRIYGWSAAFGIMVTVVWLYLEILRLLAILRD
ncbi:MAG: Bax inhibitor-1/YccA family protein [Cryobacterium sp.]|nr:Bax inhibitor-1/YccA family protein [Cryobacterium sp.]MBX3089509.1 Bax inhibitor-1/YccA family protein [Cryobacterium sp.]MCO5294773.1 Bax inhibitor-1/YccA family protein [Homoserinimonas sp.]